MFMVHLESACHQNHEDVSNSATVTHLHKKCAAIYFSTDRAVLRPPPLLEIRQKSVEDEQHRREVANKMMKFTGISGRSASVDNR